jgi:NADH-quinone oxidoreductase subunit J
MGVSIAFWVLAVTAVIGALMVITLRSLFRTALGLVLCFLSIAGLFITLSADFLGIVQILIYVGAIAVLIIMGIMLTREVECANISSRFKLPALLTGLIFLGLAIWVMLNTSWPVNPRTPTYPTAATLGSTLFGQGGYVIAVEIAGLLILSAIIGAVSVAREK